MLHGKVKKILPSDHLAAIIRLATVFSRRGWVLDIPKLLVALSK